MNKWVLIGGGMLVLGLAAWGGKVAYSATRIRVGIKSVKARLSGFTAYVDVSMSIQNPTNQAFDINGLAGSLSFAGSQIGDFAYYQGVRVEPYAETIIAVPVRVSIVGAGDLLLSVLQGQVSQIVGGAIIGIDGTVTVNHAPFPFTVTKQLI